jgi:hypothetical protein
MDLLYSILGGGFVGAGVVAILFKYLIQSSIQRSLDKHKHDLELNKQNLQQSFEREKQRLQYKIELELKEQTLNLTNFSAKKIDAMEEAYKLLISMMTIFFRIRSWDVFIEFVKTEEAKKKLISKAVSDYQSHFTKGFDSSMKAHEKLIELSVYMPDYIEEILTLVAMNHTKIIRKYSREMDEIHQRVSKGEFVDFSFQEFRLRIMEETSKTLGPAKQILITHLAQSLLYCINKQLK